MKIKLVGIHKVKATLADGSKATYFYAWRGGPRMENDDPDSRAFLLEWIRLTRERDDPPKLGTLSDLITEYKRSAAFKDGLKETTRKNKEWALQYVEEQYHDLPVSAICEKGMRREFREWRDKHADTPRKADELISALSSVLTFAVREERIERNPLEHIGKLSNGSRRDQIWTADQIEVFHKANGPEMVLAFELARWTGQRQGDLLRLTWNDYDGQSIRLKQGKTDQWVHFKVYDELRVRLNATKRKATTILTNTRGLPWKTGFGASFQAAKEAAKVTGVTFHDLRGTFVTEAYKKGATIAEIAEITGHSEKDADRIIRKHYLASDAAVLKLESGTK